MSSNITRLKKSIADKEGYMALAGARLERRCQRPGMEHTRDLVEANLVREVHELRGVAANLQRMLREVKNMTFRRIIKSARTWIRSRAIEEESSETFH